MTRKVIASALFTVTAASTAFPQAKPAAVVAPTAPAAEKHSPPRPGETLPPPPNRAAAELAYPELAVVPRASERLLNESKRESSTAFLQQLPLMTAAGLAIAAGARAKSETIPSSPEKIQERNVVAMTAMGIGATWVGFGAIIALAYRPYTDGWREIKRRKDGPTMRSNLARERASEEALAAPAAFGERVEWLATLSLAGASMAVLGNSKETASKAIASLAVAGAFIPLFVPYRWVEVYDLHEEYKKKVYGPIVSIKPLWDEQQATLRPSLSIETRF